MSSRWWTSPDGTRTVDLAAVVGTTRGECMIGIRYSGSNTEVSGPGVAVHPLSKPPSKLALEAHVLLVDSFLAALSAWRAQEIHEHNVQVHREHAAANTDAEREWDVVLAKTRDPRMNPRPGDLLRSNRDVSQGDRPPRRAAAQGEGDLSRPVNLVTSRWPWVAHRGTR